MAPGSAPGRASGGKAAGAPGGAPATEPARRRRVLLISPDIVGPTMAGAGVRFRQLAAGLSPYCQVTLAVPDDAGAAAAGDLTCVPYARTDWASVAPLVSEAEVVVAAADLAASLPRLEESDAFLVIDGYDPLVAEWLALTAPLAPEEQHVHWRRRMGELGKPYLMGDFYICASERQRDWWLGMLAAHERLNAWTYGEDPSLRSLIDVVPIGVSSAAPRPRGAAVKGVHSGIAVSDRLVVWGGGLWPWLDPVTAIRAIERVGRDRRDVRLILPGIDHPSPWMKGMPTGLEAAREAARETGLLDRGIFFLDWLEHDRWCETLAESDAALSLAFDTLEARLAFRTRTIDYIGASVPVVASRGDATSELVSQYGIGTVVEPQDVDAVASALVGLLDTGRDAYLPRFERARSALALDRVIQPLVGFCCHPHRAADRLGPQGPTGAAFYVAEVDRLRAEQEVLLQERESLLREIAHLVDDRAAYARAGHELVLARDELASERDAWRARYEGQWFVRLRRAGYRLLRRLWP